MADITCARAECAPSQRQRPITSWFQCGGCDHVETDAGSEFSGSGSRSCRRSCVSPCRENVRVGGLGRATEAVGADNGPAIRKHGIWKTHSSERCAAGPLNPGAESIDMNRALVRRVQRLEAAKRTLHICGDGFGEKKEKGLKPSGVASDFKPAYFIACRRPQRHSRVCLARRSPLCSPLWSSRRPRPGCGR